MLRHPIIFLLNELFNIEVQKGPKLKLRRKIRIEVSLDDLLISKPEVPDIDQLLASESMAGEEEEQTKTLQPHLSKQDVKTLVCKQDSTSTSLYSYIKQSLKYEFFAILVDFIGHMSVPALYCHLEFPQFYFSFIF